MYEVDLPDVHELYDELMRQPRPAELTYQQRMARLNHFDSLEAMIAAAKVRELAAHYAALDANEANHAGEELGMALAVSAPQAIGMLLEAREITGPLHPLHAALAGGRISQSHARAIRQVLSHMIFTRTSGEKETPAYALLLEKAALIAERGCEYAEYHTPSETRKVVKLWVMANDPVSAQARYEQALSERNVTHQVLDDGLGALTVVGPVEQTYRIYKGIDSTARYNSQHALPGDERSIGQHRADATLEVMLDAVSPARPSSDSYSHPDARLMSVEEQPTYVPGTPIRVARRIYDSGTFLERMLDEECGDDCNPAFDLSLPEDLGPEQSWLDDLPYQRGADVSGRFCATGVAPYQVAVSCDVETLIGSCNNEWVKL